VRVLKGGPGIHACKNGSYQVGRAPLEDILLWLTEASGEAELPAGDAGVNVVKVGSADCTPGALTEHLQRACGKTVDVDPAHQPRGALILCTWWACCCCVRAVCVLCACCVRACVCTGGPRHPEHTRILRASESHPPGMYAHLVYVRSANYQHCMNAWLTKWFRRTESKTIRVMHMKVYMPTQC